MPVTQPGAKVGVDSKGKHYKYIPGHRGRVPLDQGAASSGVKGVRGKRAADEHVKAVATKFAMSHNKWLREGGAKTSVGAEQRVKHLLSNGRGEWFTSTPHTDAHKAMAISLVGAILGRGVTGGKPVSTEGGNKIKFNPGGNGVKGHITLTDAEGNQIASAKFKDVGSLNASQINRIRNHFTDAVNNKIAQRDAMTSAVDESNAKMRASRAEQSAKKIAAFRAKNARPTVKPTAVHHKAVDDFMAKIDAMLGSAAKTLKATTAVKAGKEKAKATRRATKRANTRT